MNKISTAITILMTSLITTIMASSAFASPKSQYAHPSQQAHHTQQTHAYAKPTLNSHNQWQSGQAFPSNYHSSRYQVNYHQYSKLAKPGHNQQWYKVNGDYVLVNSQTHKILRVIR